MSDFVFYNCRSCSWQKGALVGGAVSFFFELRHCSDCRDLFPYRRPYPGENYPEPSLLCPCCSSATRKWWSTTREDLPEERDVSRRLLCPRCGRRAVHGSKERVLHPLRLTSPASFARLFPVK